MALRVDCDQDAREELMRLPVAERRGVMNAVAKLEAFGDQLGAPHTSQVKGSREGSGSCGQGRGGHRGGRCTGRVADAMVVLAVGPEAEHDRRG